MQISLSCRLQSATNQKLMADTTKTSTDFPVNVAPEFSASDPKPVNLPLGMGGDGGGGGGLGGAGGLRFTPSDPWSMMAKPVIARPILAR